MRKDKIDHSDFWKKSHNEVLEINHELGKHISFLEDKLRDIRRDALMDIVVQLPKAQRQEVKDFAEYLLDTYYREVELEEYGREPSPTPIGKGCECDKK